MFPSSLLAIPLTLLGALVLGYAIATTGIPFSSYNVPSASMLPTIRPGELIFASAHYYRSQPPVPGDIVLFHKTWHGRLVTFIKRVVAGPSDRVKMERGRLVLNGAVVERSLVPSPNPAPGFTAETQRYRETLPNGRSYEIVEMGDSEMLDEIPETLVEPGCCYVLGDYRDRSNDSRNPEFGTVGLDAIDDKASIIWLSWDWHRIGKTLQPAP